MIMKFSISFVLLVLILSLVSSAATRTSSFLVAAQTDYTDCPGGSRTLELQESDGLVTFSGDAVVNCNITLSGRVERINFGSTIRFSNVTVHDLECLTKGGTSTACVLFSEAVEDCGSFTFQRISMVAGDQERSRVVRFLKSVALNDSLIVSRSSLLLPSLVNTDPSWAQFKQAILSFDAGTVEVAKRLVCHHNEITGSMKVTGDRSVVQIRVLHFFTTLLRNTHYLEVSDNLIDVIATTFNDYLHVFIMDFDTVDDEACLGSGRDGSKILVSSNTISSGYLSVSQRKGIGVAVAWFGSEAGVQKFESVTIENNKISDVYLTIPKDEDGGDFSIASFKAPVYLLLSPSSFDSSGEVGLVVRNNIVENITSGGSIDFRVVRLDEFEGKGMQFVKNRVSGFTIPSVAPAGKKDSQMFFGMLIFSIDKDAPHSILLLPPGNFVVSNNTMESVTISRKDAPLDISIATIRPVVKGPVFMEFSYNTMSKIRVFRTGQDALMASVLCSVDMIAFHFCFGSDPIGIAGNGTIANINNHNNHNNIVVRGNLFHDVFVSSTITSIDVYLVIFKDCLSAKRKVTGFHSLLFSDNRFEKIDVTCPNVFPNLFAASEILSFEFDSSLSSPSSSSSSSLILISNNSIVESKFLASGFSIFIAMINQPVSVVSSSSPSIVMKIINNYISNIKIVETSRSSTSRSALSIFRSHKVSNLEYLQVTGNLISSSVADSPTDVLVIIFKFYSELLLVPPSPSSSSSSDSILVSFNSIYNVTVGTENALGASRTHNLAILICGGSIIPSSSGSSLGHFRIESNQISSCTIRSIAGQLNGFVIAQFILESVFGASKLTDFSSLSLNNNSISTFLDLNKKTQEAGSKGQLSVNFLVWRILQMSFSNIENIKKIELRRCSIHLLKSSSAQKGSSDLVLNSGSISANLCSFVPLGMPISLTNVPSGITVSDSEILITVERLASSSVVGPVEVSSGLFDLTMTSVDHIKFEKINVTCNTSNSISVDAGGETSVTAALFKQKITSTKTISLQDCHVAVSRVVSSSVGQHGVAALVAFLQPASAAFTFSTIKSISVSQGSLRLLSSSSSSSSSVPLRQDETNASLVALRMPLRDPDDNTKQLHFSLSGLSLQDDTGSDPDFSKRRCDVHSCSLLSIGSAMGAKVDDSNIRWSITQSTIGPDSETEGSVVSAFDSTFSPNRASLSRKSEFYLDALRLDARCAIFARPFPHPTLLSRNLDKSSWTFGCTLPWARDPLRDFMRFANDTATKIVFPCDPLSATKAETETLTRSREITQPTFPPEELPRVSDQFVDSTNGLQGTNLAVSAAVSAVVPTLSFGVARQQAMLGFVTAAKSGSCRGIDESNFKPAAADSPTQMQVGSSIARYYIGGAVGNGVLAFSLVIGAELLGVLYMKRIGSSSWNKPYKVFARCHVALVAFVFFSLLLAPTLTLGLVAVAQPKSIVSVPSKFLTILFCLLFLAAALYQAIWALYKRDNVEKYKLTKLSRREQEEQSKIKKLLSYWFEGPGEWTMPNRAPASLQRELNAKDHLDFDAANPVFDGYNNRAPRFAVAEYAVQIGLALASFLAQVVPEKVSCVTQAVVLCVTLCAYLFLCLWLRPFQEKFNIIVMPVMTAIQIVIVVIVAAMGAEQPSWIESLAVFSASMQSAVAIVVLLASFGPLMKPVLRVWRNLRRRGGGGADGEQEEQERERRSNENRQFHARNALGSSLGDLLRDEDRRESADDDEIEMQMSLRRQRRQQQQQQEPQATASARSGARATDQQHQHQYQSRHAQQQQPRYPQQQQHQQQQQSSPRSSRPSSSSSFSPSRSNRNYSPPRQQQNYPQHHQHQHQPRNYRDAADVGISNNNSNNNNNNNSRHFEQHLPTRHPQQHQDREQQHQRASSSSRHHHDSSEQGAYYGQSQQQNYQQQPRQQQQQAQYPNSRQPQQRQNSNNNNNNNNTHNGASRRRM